MIDPVFGETWVIIGGNPPPEDELEDELEEELEELDEVIPPLDELLEDELELIIEVQV